MVKPPWGCEAPAPPASSEAKEEMKTINVEVQGITPLLMNRFRDASIDVKSKKRTGAQTEPSLEDKLYLIKDEPHMPAVYFRNCLIEAGKQFKVAGKGKATYSKLLGCSVEVAPDMIKILPGEYDEYRVAAVNPMTKGRMMVSRPRFNKWKCVFQIKLLDDALPVSVVNEVLEHAGRMVGVGDWRPDKKGTHGKFMVTSFEEE